MKKDTSESSSEKTEPESDSEDELVSSRISKNFSLFKPETDTSSEDQKKFARKKKIIEEEHQSQIKSIQRSRTNS